MERDESAININDLTPEARERYFRYEIATAEKRTEMEQKVGAGLLWVTSELGGHRLSRREAGALYLTICDQWFDSNSQLGDKAEEMTDEGLISTLRQAFNTAFEAELYTGDGS